MKTLTLTVVEVPAETGRISYLQLQPANFLMMSTAIKSANFTNGEPVTLVPTASLAPLLARETYRVHCWECHECECYIQVSGTPAPDSLCPEGQRLAAAIQPAKEGGM